MKPSRTRRLSLIAAAVACCFTPQGGLANPTGPKVVNGTASFNQQGKLLTVTNSPGSIINWQGFSIAAGETTRFVQQSSNSAVLNRVIGPDASGIFGALQSNGRVWLVNPNGILIGKGAQIDTAGLIASTLNVMNTDFLLGRMRFVDTPGAKGISNAGEIRTPEGGRVVLISPQGVENSGLIQSPKGEVILAAGKTIEIADSTNPEVRIEIAAPEARAINLGKIVAESGRVGIYGGIVANRGLVSADSAVVGENGKIVFRATRDVSLEPGSVTTASGPSGGSIEVQSEGTTLVAGTVRATGSADSGGQVHVLGQNVGVIEQASIDASGARGGGTVLVGGDLRGENPNVRNAQMTFVGADTSIKADALSEGNGGKVIVWADDTTRSHGSISARGGALGGDGGFVETSGKLNLSVTRGPDVRAPAGPGGTWLIDPNNITIVPGQVLDATTNTGAPFFAPLVDGSIIGVDLINAQLDIGSNVIINTTSRGASAGTDLGNIILAAPIVKTAATVAGGPVIGTTSLTFQAHNDIIIDPTGSITATGNALNVTLTANADNVGGGALTVNGPIKTNGGFVNLQGAGLVAVNAPIHTLNPNGIGGGSFSATSTASGFTIQPAGSVTSSGATLIADTIALAGPLNAGAGLVIWRQRTNGAALTLSNAELGQIVTTGGLSVGNRNAGPVVVTAPLTLGAISQLEVVTGSTFTQNAGAAITVSGPISIIATAGITLNAPLSASSAAFRSDAFAPNQPVTSTSDITLRVETTGRAINLGVAAAGTGALDLTSAQLDNLNTSAAGILRIGNVSTGPLSIQGSIAPAGTSNLRLHSNSSITQAAGATITETNLALQVNNGSINLPEANAVGTIAAQLCCTTGNFTFKNAAGTPLTIGTVDFINGIRNFSSDASTTAMISADNLTISSSLQIPNGTVFIKPVTSANRVDFGGADAAGVLGLSAGDLALISAGKLIVMADTADISAPIAPTSVGSFGISPITAGRALNIVAGPKNPANLELVQSDIGNVTATSLQLGDATTGPVNVNAALTVPASIGTFGLQSGDAASGLMVNAALSATNNVSLQADLMTLNALTSSSAGSLTVANTSAGRMIDLGTRTAGKLALSKAEIETQLSATAGTLTFGSGSAGNLDVTSILSIINAAGVSLVSDGIATVGLSQSLSASGNVTMSAPRITLNGAVNSTAGNVTLIGDRMDIASTVSAPAGNITAYPLSFRSIDLGTDDTVSILGFTPAEINNFMPSGVLRFGDLDNTANITVRAAIAPASATTLSLVTGNGSITQTANSTISVSNLAARAASNITLDQNNDTDTVAAQSDFGNISITYSGTNPLNIGVVDGLTGVQAFGGNIVLRSDELNINQRVDAAFGSGDVTLVALNPNQAFAIGTKGGLPGLLEAELNRIGAFNLFIGDASAGNATVTAPVNITGGVFNLVITTSPTASVAVSNALTVPGDITINTGTLNTTAAMTSASGAINAKADAMTFGALASSGGGSITLQPQTAGTLVALGGSDSSSPTTLGLDATDLGNLSYGTGTLTIGSTAAGDMDVTFAGALPGSVELLTGGQVTFNSNFSAGSALSVTANKMSIPGANGISAPDGVTITTATFGRNMTLGTTPGVATDFELSLADINKISIAGAGTLKFDTGGTLTTTAPLAFTSVPNVALSGGTLVHTGGALSASGDITFNANSMPAAGFSTLTSTGGGRITFAPRTFRSINVGTNPAGGSLGIAASQLAQVSTSGVVQIGDSIATSSVTFSAPSTQPAGSSALTVIAGNSILQNAGATITASNLNLQADNAVTLTQANSVGTLAGTSFGNFSFTTAGTLTIGTVDGLSGINDNTITVLSDGINILSPVVGGTTTFAPRLAGTAIALGSGSGYVLTDAAIDQITGFTLNIGNNTSGPISVNSTVDRAFGNLALTTAPGSAITIGAPLGSTAMSSISMDTGLGGTVSIGGAVQAGSAISVIGRTITTDAPITSSFSNVTLGAAAGDTGSSITVNQPISAGNNIVLTADTQNINAALNAGFAVTLQPRSNGTPITVGGGVPGTLSIPNSTLSLINARQLTIGNGTAGNLTVASAIGPFIFDSLSLTTGGSISQLPGATITVSNPNPTNPSLPPTGSLNVSAGGPITLTESNNIAQSLTGNTSAPGNSFLFNNVGPLKLQNVTASASFGTVRISSGVTPSVPSTPIGPPPQGSTTQDPVDDILNTILQPDKLQQQLDKESEAQADAAKKEAEQDKKEGRKSCG